MERIDTTLPPAQFVSDVEGRRGVAGHRLADVLKQRGAQGLHQLRGDDVDRLRAAADPLAQMIEVGFFGDGFGPAWPLRARGVMGSSTWSPMPGTAP